MDPVLTEKVLQGTEQLPEEDQSGVQIDGSKQWSKVTIEKARRLGGQLFEIPKSQTNDKEQ